MGTQVKAPCSPCVGGCCEQNQQQNNMANYNNHYCDCTGALLVMVLSSVRPPPPWWPFGQLYYYFWKTKAWHVKRIRFSSTALALTKQLDKRMDEEKVEAEALCAGKRVVVCCWWWNPGWMDGGGMQMNGFAWPQGRILIPFVTN